MTSHTDRAREELRAKLLEVFSVNFNDNVPVLTRYDSSDMYSTSDVVDFIDDFVIDIIMNELDAANYNRLRKL